MHTEYQSTQQGCLLIWCLNMLNTANGVPALQLVQLQSPIQNLDLLMQCDQEQPRSAHVSWQPSNRMSRLCSTSKFEPAYRQRFQAKQANQKSKWNALGFVLYYDTNYIDWIISRVYSITLGCIRLHSSYAITYLRLYQIIQINNMISDSTRPD